MTMTHPTTEQRELLELAAKAAGKRIDKSPYNGGGAGNTGFDCMGNAVLDWHNGEKWNPLTDDGDALRLAVKLGIDVEHEMSFVRCGWSAGRSGAPTRDGKGPWYWCERLTDSPDPYAATRLCIVRAAAAIAKGEKA